MKAAAKQPDRRAGFSLGEMLAALVIGALVLTAILAVYSRADRAAEAVLAKVETPALAAEVLQLIAEDLDCLLGATGQEASIKIEPGFDKGFARSRLVVRRTFHDAQNTEKTFEEITWLAGYDYDGPAGGLVIYRSHEGIELEDKLLDPKRANWEENYPLVPICRGVTFFRIEVPKGEDDEFLDRWTASSLPPGVRVTISFAEPYETVRGTFDVLDHQKITRTIAIDTTRAIRFASASPTGPMGQADANDVEARTDAEANAKASEKASTETTASRNKSTDGRTRQETRRR